jgi:hypothetical protein
VSGSSARVQAMRVWAVTRPDEFGDALVTLHGLLAAVVAP